METPTMSYEPQAPLPEPKKNRTGLIIAVVVLVLCCCCLVVLLGGWFGGDAILEALGGM